MTNSLKEDSRIYTDLQQLKQFKYYRGQFSFHPLRQATSKKLGRHNSRFRGQGINFEEYRHYQLGDDVRSLDWRVTLRTGQPHVRVYSEEREQPVILLIDQRLSMFFSSQHTMKSVIAAHIASLCAWRVIKDGDRVGGLVFNDSDQQWFSAQRSSKQTLQLLSTIHKYNHALSTENKATDPSTTSMRRALNTLEKAKLHGALILAFTDGKGFDEQAIRSMQNLLTKNDVMFFRISDPLEKTLPSHTQFFVSNGEQQLLLPTHSKLLLDKYKQHNTMLENTLKAKLRMQGSFWCELGTQGSHIEEFQSVFNRRR